MKWIRGQLYQEKAYQPLIYMFASSLYNKAKLPLQDLDLECIFFFQDSQSALWEKSETWWGLISLWTNLIRAYQA